MADKHSLLDTLHETTHLVPGIPAHADRPGGHQGDAHHGHAHHDHARHGTGRLSHRTRNHSPARPPRVLAAWQRRIAALFGWEL